MGGGWWASQTAPGSEKGCFQKGTHVLGKDQASSTCPSQGPRAPSHFPSLFPSAKKPSDPTCPLHHVVGRPGPCLNAQCQGRNNRESETLLKSQGCQGSEHGGSTQTSCLLGQGPIPYKGLNHRGLDELG